MNVKKLEECMRSKVLFAGTALMMSLFLLTGCGGSESGTRPSTPLNKDITDILNNGTNQDNPPANYPLQKTLPMS